MTPSIGRSTRKATRAAGPFGLGLTCDAKRRRRLGGRLQVRPVLRASSTDHRETGAYMLQTGESPDMAPYLKPGRLADVIAAIQVMASAERPEREIKDWAYELDRNRDTATIVRWTSVFQEHREFFVTYRLQGGGDLKAALRWRYVFRTFDSKTGKEYTPAEIETLSKEQRSLLTTKPLAGEHIQTLLNTAIGLHTRAMEELGAARWWVPLLAAFLGFGGAILGAILSALFGLDK